MAHLASCIKEIDSVKSTVSKQLIKDPQKELDSNQRKYLRVALKNFYFDIGIDAGVKMYHNVPGKYDDVESTVIREAFDSNSPGKYRLYYEEPHMRGFSAMPCIFFSDKEMDTYIDKILNYVEQYKAELLIWKDNKKD